ncbi:MAG: DUF4163 domain-containing protein [Lachnospiraceae bacterium]|nr:DUF4163 domain-containing protein [Lachnospiraceae bacterium]
MKRKKLIALCMLVCLGLSGCSQQTASGEETVNDAQVQEETKENQQAAITYLTESDVITAEDGKEIYRYDYSYPVVSVAGNEKVSQEIAKDQENRKVEFMESSKINEASAKEMYDGATEEEKEYFEGFDDYSYYANKRNDSKVISFTKTVWSYVGGAHGGSYTLGINYDRNTGKILTLDDIFENKEEALDIIKTYILKQCEYPYYQERLFEDYEQYIDDVLAEEYWYLGTEGFHVISNEYVLGTYAAGVFEFLIPYSEVQGLKEVYQPEGAYIYPMVQGADVEMDLDSDGVKENICFSIKTTQTQVGDQIFDVPECVLTINDQDRTEEFMEVADYYQESISEYYYLVDLDKNDQYKEIAICDYGSNDNNVTYFIRYSQGELKYVGTIEEIIGGETCSLSGNGSVKAKVRSDMVETVNIQYSYILQNNELKVQEQEWYPIDVSYHPEEYQNHSILKEVTVYTQKDTASEAKILTPSDGTVRFPATDNKEWVQVQTQDETIYYLHVTGPLEIDNAGIPTSVSEIFDNLLIAG